MKKTLSRKNPDYISKERYYELKHFCLQYPEWRQELRRLDGYLRGSTGVIQTDSRTRRPTEEIATLRATVSSRIEIVETALRRCSDIPMMQRAVLIGVTQGVPYEVIKARSPDFWETRDVYYETYRHFFYCLNEERR